MNKIYYFILFCFAALCFTACSDDDPEFSGIEGKDHYISDFALSVGGITYQATIAGEKITVEIPYNTDLEGATAAYTLSEGATINPNPSTIQDWENEWKFVVTSKMQESKVYSYTYRYADIEQSGSVVLATQAEVDNFAETGINRIDGNLTIGTAEGEEISNLEGLIHLKQISNSLIVNPSYKGTDLSGLDNLEQIGGFRLGSITSTSKNTTLKTISLPSLLGVVGDFVVNCSAVEKVSIPKVETVEGDVYVISDSLLDLEANALASVGASLVVKGTTESNPKKGHATTEAIVFNSLKQVGNDLAIQYFPKLQGVYLPALEHAGAASFIGLEVVGSIAMTELRSVGDFTIESYNVSNVSLPALVTSGKMYISAPVNNFDISSLKNINGEMYLGVVNLTTLDVSAIDFNGNTLHLYACNQLSKITGPETFNGSFYINTSKVENFTIEGVSNIQGSFTYTTNTKLKNFIMPFSRIAGDVVIGLSRANRGVSIESIQFPKLQEIGGKLDLTYNRFVKKIEFPVLKRIIGNDNYIGTAKIDDGCIFNELESIGSTPDATTEFYISDGEIKCPKLKTISGSLEISTNTSTITAISYPTLEAISNKLTISRGDEVVTNIDFSGLKTIQQVAIESYTGVSDFSTFRYLFENNILTEASQWTVTKCGYNPTFQDMKDGKYTPAE